MSSQPLIRKRFLWAIFFINIIALPLILFMGHLKNSAKTAVLLPVYGKIELGHRFTEKNGEEAPFNELRGKIWVADFIFTRCAGQCPLVTMKMSLLQKTLPANVLLASFSVDPTNDTPEILSAYAKTYGALDKRWFFFTGDINETNRLMNELHLGKIDDPSAHSLRLVLLDKNAVIRGYYDSSDEASVKKLVQDTQILLKESA